MDKKPYMDRVRDREKKIQNSDRFDSTQDFIPDEEGRARVALYPQVSSSESDAAGKVGRRLRGDSMARRVNAPPNTNTEPEDNSEEGGFRKGGMVSMKGGGSVRGAGVAERGQGKMRMF